MSKSTKAPVTATLVREWAAENGLPAQPVGTRGRLPKATIEAFNKAHPRGKFLGNPAPKVTLSAKPEKGRTRTRTATVAEVRAFAVANGLAKPSRGRLSNEAKRAFVLGIENV